MTDSKMTIEDGDKVWRNAEGKFHRTDGPAVEGADGDKAWYVDGLLHRLDGPAVEWASGTKQWWVDDKLHRLDGPAYEWADGSKQWWVNGKRHRTDGPAIEWANGYKAWYVDGEELTEAEFNERTRSAPDDVLQAIKILKDHNEWRRGVEGYEMCDPAALGCAIDLVCDAALRQTQGDDLWICRRRVHEGTTCYYFFEPIEKYVVYNPCGKK